MTPCERKHDDIFDFNDGELDAARKKEVKRHLDECCDCNKLLRKIRLQKAALRRCASLKTNDSFFILLQDRIRRENAGKRNRRELPVFGIPRWVPAFAFGLMVIAIAGWMLTRKEAPVMTADGAAPKIGTVRPASKSVAPKVRYVIDEYPRTLSKATVQVDSTARLAAADSIVREKDFDALKGRLTQVSF
jgi:anti-sigma factor RsiW